MQSGTIIRPVVTEKSLMLANTQNIYTFEVARLATKHQVWDAVEELYSVKVTNVNTVKQQESTRMTGKKRMRVTSPQKKKALVTLQKGQTIELFDLGGKQ